MPDLPTPITTQEALDAVVEGRLQRARQTWERESGLPNIERERDEARQRANRAERDGLDRLVRRDARDVLATMNVRDPKRQQLVLRLADLSGVQADDQGEPNRKTITDALKAVHKDTPDVFGADATVTDSAPDSEAGTGASGEGSGAAGNGPLTHEQVSNMTPNEINSSWDRVKSFLSGERS